MFKQTDKNRKKKVDINSHIPGLPVLAETTRGLDLCLLQNTSLAREQVTNITTSTSNLWVY